MFEYEYVLSIEYIQITYIQNKSASKNKTTTAILLQTIKKVIVSIKANMRH